MKYRPSPDFVLALVIIATLALGAAYLTGAIHLFEQSKQVTQSVTLPRVHLPTKCRPYYNDGTDRWIDCMGVGYK